MEELLKKIIEFFKKFFNKKEVIEPVNIIEQNQIESGSAKTEIIMDEKLNLRLKRIYTCSTYTIGHLYINEDFFCDTIEDIDRNLCSTMREEEINKIKVASQTAIPIGTYAITMNVKSPKYSNFTKYKWAEPYDGYLPRLLNIKCFEGVLIHPGTDQNSTSGCLIVGENKVKGKVINSQDTFHKLMNNFLLPAKEKNIDIEITIEQCY